MSYAPSKTYFDADGTILGCFRLKENDNLFEYSVKDDDPDLLDFGEFDGIFPDNFPHKVWVTAPWEMDRGYRYARVLKTVCYILVSGPDNETVMEKWLIKNNTPYESRS